MSSLWQLFLNNQGRVVHKWKQYFPVYERHFSRYVDRPVTFLEIGCGEGGSLQMWRQYFGPYATIIGIDNKPACKAYEEDQIHIRIGDQGDPEFLASVVGEFGPPDVVLDDGSHQMKHLEASFKFLYPRVARDGVYFAEDLHTCYWPELGGGYKNPASFIEKCKDMIDDLNADFARGQIEITDFTRKTLSMHFYDSCVVFEKGSSGTKLSFQIGAPV